MRSLVLVALGVCLVQCAPPSQAKLEVSLVIEHCGPAQDPFDGVKFLGAQASGEPEVVTAVSGPLERVTTEIAVGLARTVEVRGYDADPARGGKLISRGRSAPFDVGAEHAPPPVRLFLRRAGAWSCGQHLIEPRAGHSATATKDGKVLLAGGYDLLSGGTPEALVTTELFDPATETFTAGREVSIANGVQRLPRARQSGTLLQNGQILLWGGETYSSTTTLISSIILVFDSDENAFGPLPTRIDPPSIPRTRHGAAADALGHVVIAGGLTRDQNGQLIPAEAVEWFEPMQNSTFVAKGLSLPRDGASVLALDDGGMIAVAGGTDGGAVADDVALLRWNGSTFVRDASSPRITARRDAASALISGRLFLAGGFSDPAGTVPIGSTELVDTVSGMSTPGPAIASRGGACAVAVDDFTVLIAGGQDGTVASAAAELVHLDADGGTTMTPLPALPVARFDHSCTLLADGTVMIAGGANEHGVLQDAYILQP